MEFKLAASDRIVKWSLLALNFQNCEGSEKQVSSMMDRFNVERVLQNE